MNKETVPGWSVTVDIRIHGRCKAGLEWPRETNEDRFKATGLLRGALKRLGALILDILCRGLRASGRFVDRNHTKIGEAEGYSTNMLESKLLLIRSSGTRPLMR